MARLMGQREYARHRGCALRAVQKAIQSGRIKVVRDDKGRDKIDADQADKDWLENTDPAKQSLLYQAGASTAPDSPEDLEGEAPPEGQTPAYRVARGEREQVRLARERIELEQLQGKLIDLEEAKRLAFSAFRALRDGLLNIPARIKDQVAAQADAHLVEQIIEREITDALASFDLERVTSDRDDDDEDDDDA